MELSDSETEGVSSKLVIYVCFSFPRIISMLFDTGSSMVTMVLFPLVSGPAVVAKKRPLPVEPPHDDDWGELQQVLEKDCSCKQLSSNEHKPSCLWRFRSMPLFARLKDWRVAFKELHKLDQDRMVPCYLNCFYVVSQTLTVYLFILRS